MCLKGSSLLSTPVQLVKPIFNVLRIITHFSLMFVRLFTATSVKLELLHGPFLCYPGVLPESSFKLNKLFEQAFNRSEPRSNVIDIFSTIVFLCTVM